MTKRITYGIDEKGNRLGEAHQRAKLSDEDVELIRGIYEEGMESMGTLAKVFNVGKTTIADIIGFRRRATTPTGYKTIAENELKKPLPKSRLMQLGIEVEPITDWDDWDGNH